MNEKQKCEYQAIVLGALLHDIGKFMQRAEVETPGFQFDHWKETLCQEGHKFQQVIWTKYFIDEMLHILPTGIDKIFLSDSASGYYKTQTIISEADCISAGKEIYETEQRHESNKHERLHSIFDIIELKYKMTDQNNNFTSTYYHNLKPLSLTGKENILFPKKKEDLDCEKTYQKSTKNFGLVTYMKTSRAFLKNYGISKLQTSIFILTPSITFFKNIPGLFPAPQIYFQMFHSSIISELHQVLQPAYTTGKTMKVQKKTRLSY